MNDFGILSLKIFIWFAFWRYSKYVIKIHSKPSFDSIFLSHH
jgi:hypothetical protein